MFESVLKDIFSPPITKCLLSQRITCSEPTYLKCLSGKLSHRSMLLLFSIFIRNRNAFLILVAAAAALKLVLSAVEPASEDLGNIITLVASGHAPVGPWIALYPPLYNQTTANINQLQSWTLAVPLGSAELSLLFRLPVFLFDLATLITLFYVGRKMKTSQEGRLMALIWFLNPFSFMGVELSALPDIVCVFLVTLSLLLLISERPLLSAATLGLGAFIKLFPIFLLPPLLVYMHLNGARAKPLLSAFLLGALGFSGYLAWVLPYGTTYLAKPTPVTQLVPFVGGIPNTVNIVTFGMFAFYCLLFIFVKKAEPLPIFLLTLIVYYLLAVPGPQYLIWLLPLIAVDLAFADRLKILVVAILLASAFLEWFLASSAFLTPSGYSLLMFPMGGENVPSYSVALGNFLDSDLVGIIILPLVSSATFAFLLAYAAEQLRPWFHGSQT